MNESLQKAIRRGIYALIAVAASIFIFVLLQVVGGVGSLDRSYNTINVTGDAEVFAEPDVATISFGARAENLELPKAQEEVENVMSSALDTIKALGVDEEDIKTTNYNTYPRYEYNRNCGQFGCETGERELSGYEVSQNVTVKIRDLDNVSGVLAALGEARVSDIHGPSFEIDDRDALVQEAKEEAIKEAKKRAEELAEELGVKLKGIVSYYDDESDFFYEGGIESMMMEASFDGAVATKSFSPTIPEGENRIYQSVSITYKIK